MVETGPEVVILIVAIAPSLIVCVDIGCKEIEIGEAVIIVALPDPVPDPYASVTLEIV